MSCSQKVWLSVLFMLFFECLACWPSLFVLFDGQTSPVKFWIYITSGALSLNILLWNTGLFIGFPQHWSPRKINASILIWTILVIVSCGFCSIGLIDLLMSLQDNKQYIRKLLYMYICTSVSIYQNIFSNVLPNTRYLCFNYRLSRKCSVLVDFGVFFIIIAICAACTLVTVSGNYPARQNLLVLLAGLVSFLLFWLVIQCGRIQDISRSLPRSTKAAIAIYLLIYIPAYTYWTVHSLSENYAIMSTTDFKLTWKICLLYSVIFYIIYDGVNTWIHLLFMLGVIILANCKILSIDIPVFLDNAINSWREDAYQIIDSFQVIDAYQIIDSFQVIDSSQNFLHDPPQNLDQPHGIIFGGEGFDPKKHTNSFVEKEVCSVCFESYRPGELVTYWPVCKHAFHTSCLNTWTQNKITCPNCRRLYAK